MKKIYEDELNNSLTINYFLRHYYLHNAVSILHPILLNSVLHPFKIVNSPFPYTITSWKVKVKSISRVRLFATPWTVAYQAPPSMGFFKQYWSGLPFPSPGDVPDPGTEPSSPALQADALTSEPPGKP